MIFQREWRVELPLASFAIRARVNLELFDQHWPPQPSVARVARVFSLAEREVNNVGWAA